MKLTLKTQFGKTEVVDIDFTSKNPIKQTRQVRRLQALQKLGFELAEVDGEGKVADFLRNQASEYQALGSGYNGLQPSKLFSMEKAMLGDGIKADFDRAHKFAGKIICKIKGGERI